MSLSSDMTITPINPLLTVGTGVNDSQGSSIPMPTQIKQYFPTLQSEVDWSPNHSSESISASNSPLGVALEQYILENFNITTELTQAPQTAIPPQVVLIDTDGNPVPTAAVSAENLPATEKWNGSYTVTAAPEYGTLTVNAQRQDGTLFQSIISDFRLSAFKPGDTLTIPFTGPEGSSFQLTLMVPTKGTAQLPSLLTGTTLKLTDGQTEKSAAFTTVATFPGANAVPLSAKTAAVRLSNGVTVFVSPVEQLDAASPNQGSAQVTSAAVPQQEFASPAGQLSAQLTSSPSVQAQQSTLPLSVASQAASPLPATRILLHSSDVIELGTGSPFPLFQSEAGPVFAGFTLANISTDSPLLTASNTPLQLFFTGGTGESVTFTMVANGQEYTAALTPTQISQFMNVNTPITVEFLNTAGLPDTITLSLIVAAAMDDSVKRTQLKLQPPPNWEPDMMAMELAGSASVPIPKDEKQRRVMKRFLLGSLNLTASVLSLSPIGAYLGGVTALVGNMAQADQEDSLCSSDEIHDILSAKARTLILQKAILQYGKPPISGTLSNATIYSLLH